MSKQTSEQQQIVIKNILNQTDFSMLTRQPNGLVRSLNTNQCSKKDLKRVHQHLLRNITTVEQLRIVYKTCSISIGLSYETILKKVLNLCKTQQDCQDAISSILDLHELSLYYLFQNHPERGRVFMKILRKYRKLKK